MVTLHEVITFLVSMQISISSLQTHNVNRCGRSRHLARKLLMLICILTKNVITSCSVTMIDRKSGSAGMPRPISYAVFCLKKKNLEEITQVVQRGCGLAEQTLLLATRGLDVTLLHDQAPHA